MKVVTDDNKDGRSFGVLLSSTKTECDNLNVWIKNGHILKNVTENGEPQRSSWRTQKKKDGRGVAALTMV